PHTFQIRYSGPRNDVRGSYQGVIYVAGEGLSVIPYAFVDLRVGESGGASPQFLVNGVPSEYVAFPGRSGDDTGRPPVTVSIRNNGTTPMELAAEIGPEVWLVPERGWNDGRVEPNSSRSVNLFTRRVFAPNGSALPRYTYFTVRTKDGASARLLVQDNDDIRSTRGRNVALPSGERSFIVPEVTSRLTTAGALIATRLRLTNAGTEAVQTELIFTPSSTDGFDANGVRRAVVVVPANDVVTLTDPLAQVFALTRPASGQLEIRVPVERLGLVSATASTVAIDGNRSTAIPTVNRGDGARLNRPHTLFGATENSSATTALVLAETSGIDGARARVSLFDPNGQRVGESTYELRRYGYQRVENIVAALGGSTLEYGRIDLTVESGSGSITGVAIVRDRNGESAATFVSRASDEGTGTTRLLAHFAKGGAAPLATIPSITTVVPVLNTPASAGTAPAYRTVISFAATTAATANFKAVLKGLNGAEIASTPPIDVPRGTTLVLKDAPKDLFGAAAAPGSIFVEATGGGKVYALLQATSSSLPGGAPSASIPLPTTVSEVLSSASGSMQRPLFFDGLEQSTDPSRGNRWMLLINEVSGQSGTVRVSLYEAGNRTSAIAQKEIAVNAYQQATLDTVFAELGLDAADRRKDRTNVQVVVTAVSGGARVAASAVSIDNRTGDTKLHSLAPSAGSGSTGTTLVTAVPPPPPTAQPGRRRATRR
ncbi:MAG TPA: hypothetical protein VFL80_07455, partial [Thermoanaerobaculia bacterium]|nr:hypothetical protein [Thermoanaerobaculia bacterium]